MRSLLAIILTMLLAIAVGCDNEPTTGDKIRETGDAIGDAVKDVSDGVSDAAEDIKDDVEDINE